MLGLRSLIALLLCSTFTVAADWPQWLGPNRDNSSTEKVSPWKNAPTVVWRQPVGEGNSSPILADGRVYLHSRVKDKDEEEIVALDAKTGKELWRYQYPRANFTSLYGNGPRATPAVVDGKLYTHGLTGVLTCLDAAKGEKVWQVDTWDKFKAPKLFFGAACSPLIEGDQVVLNVGGKGSSIVAFDRKTGDVAWQTLDDKASYSSPAVRGSGKSRELLFLTGENVVGLKPEKGEVAWKYPLIDALAESATTPVQTGDILFATSITYGGVGLTNDGKEAWKSDKYNSYFTTPVAIGKDHLCMVTCTKPPALRYSATLRFVEAATGKELWAREKVGQYHASLLRTGDGKILMLEDSGNLVLVEPTEKEYRELARSKVCGFTWAHPALVDGKLYVRDGKEVLCLQLGD